MSDALIPASSTQYRARTRSPEPTAELPRRHLDLLAFPNLVEIYLMRWRFRRELEQMSRENPHLIADIGLTKWQAEAEVARRFWQA